MKHKLFYILYLFSFVLLVFGGLELYFNALLNHPENCPDRWKEVFINYYKAHDCSYIQQEEEMAQYDSSLFYTLKPGEFTYKNREFSTPFLVNSIGLRDDEQSLENPKIVMVGDSYGMGWGIQQDETYAGIVQEKLNTNVLNAGISSYGTPREMKMLERINTDSMEYLIIQYCPNDYIELVEYIKHDNQLIVSSEKTYDSICNYVRKQSHYYPFKTTIELIPLLTKGKGNNDIIQKTKNTIPTPINAVKGFLDVIRNSKKIPATTKIYVFTLDKMGFSNYFLQNVEKNLKREFSSTLHDQLHFLDFSEILTPKNYFILDEHINQSGHQIIADTLIKHLKTSSKGGSEKKWYYDDGTLCIHASYFSHYKEGVTTYYWPNGNRSQQSTFHKGEKIGEEIIYNETGKEITRKFYSKDDLN